MATLCSIYESVIPFSEPPIQNQYPHQKNRDLEFDHDAWVTLRGLQQIIPEIVSTSKCSKFYIIHPWLQKLFFKKNWRISVLLVGSLTPLFWTSGDVCPAFHSQGGSIACLLRRLIVQAHAGCFFTRKYSTACWKGDCHHSAFPQASYPEIQ